MTTTQPLSIAAMKALAARHGIHWPESRPNEVPECVVRQLLAHPVAGPIVRGEVDAPAPQAITPEALAEAIRAALAVPEHFGQIPEAIAEHLLAHPCTGPLLRGKAVTPTRASERPWKRPGWLDAEERCWGFNANERAWRLRYVLRFTEGADRHIWRWLLPAGAIQVPAEEDQS